MDIDDDERNSKNEMAIADTNGTSSSSSSADNHSTEEGNATAGGETIATAVSGEGGVGDNKRLSVVVSAAKEEIEDALTTFAMNFIKVYPLNGSEKKKRRSSSKGSSFDSTTAGPTSPATTPAPVSPATSSTTEAKPPVPTISPVLEGVISEMRKTGVPYFRWEKGLKELLAAKLLVMIDAFHAEHGWLMQDGGPTYEERRDGLLNTLGSFDEAPFTLQRLAEVLVNPSRQYLATHKLANGLDKLLSVSSTLSRHEKPLNGVCSTDVPLSSDLGCSTPGGTPLLAIGADSISNGSTDGGLGGGSGGDGDIDMEGGDALRSGSGSDSGSGNGGGAVQEDSSSNSGNFNAGSADDDDAAMNE